MRSISRAAAARPTSGLSQRGATAIAVALCLLAASAATVAAQARTSVTRTAPQTASRPGSGHRTLSSAQHVLTVYPGPLSVPMVQRAIAWWASAGADVRLQLTTDPATADVVILPSRPLGGTEAGVAETPCVVPCRPQAPETITLSSVGSYDHLWTLVHELGHAQGLGHTHGPECSVMTPVIDETCPPEVLPATVPPIDRRDLIAIWGTATSN